MHCPGCNGGYTQTHPSGTTLRFLLCPGVTCQQCAQNAVLIAELWDTLNAKDADISRLTAERDALRADLRACAEALQACDNHVAYRSSEYARTVGILCREVLARPGVHAVLKHAAALAKWRSLEGK